MEPGHEFAGFGVERIALPGWLAGREAFQALVAQVFQEFDSPGASVAGGNGQAVLGEESADGLKVRCRARIGVYPGHQAERIGIAREL